MTSRAKEPATALALVGLAFFVAQAALIGFDRPPSYDEAVYISQVSDDVPTLIFSAQRARGITLLIAPMALPGWTGAPLYAFLAILCAAGLVLAFRVWVPLIGAAAVVAAAAFATTWVALFYGSAAMPNLPVALLGVAAAGFAARMPAAGSARGGIAAGALLALMGLFRPPDATALGAGLVLVSLARPATTALRRSAPLAAGALLGWVPWVIEWWVRGGGPLAGVRQASAIQGQRLGWNLAEHLALTDGPILGPDPSPGLPAAGAAWWAVILALSAAGVALSRGQSRRAASVAAVGGVFVSLPYLIVDGPAAPRFLLPAYALLAVAMGLGAYALWTRAATRRGLAIAVALAVAMPWTAVNAAGARRARDVEVTKRAGAAALGAALAARVSHRPCAFASQNNHPLISFGSGCVGYRATPNARRRLEVLRARGYAVYALISGDPDESAFLGWDAEQLREGWVLLAPPERS